MFNKYTRHTHFFFAAIFVRHELEEWTVYMIITYQCSFLIILIRTYC